MKTILFTVMSLPFLAFGQKSEKADCLIALGKIDFNINSSPTMISPSAGFEWQWDGKEISLLKSPDKKTTQPEPAWGVAKYKETADGRFVIKSQHNSQLPQKNLEELQGAFLRLSFLTLLRTAPTAQNAIELDKAYSECEGLRDITPAKGLFNKNIETNKSIGELSRVHREKIRSQFPLVFKTSPVDSNNGVK